MNRTSSLGLALVLLAACSRSEPEPVKPEPTSTTASATAAASTSAPATAVASTTASAAASGNPANLPATITWKAPPKFKEEAGTKPMRLATYHGPKVGSDTEEPTLAVSQAGGAMEANVERWIGQFNPLTKKTITARQLAGFGASIVEAHGTFSGGMTGGGPKEKWMLLGAIVPVKDGAFFFKLVGPEASVEAARVDFDALLASLHSAP